MRTGKSVLGALAALAIGAIGGILFAPEKGSKARKQIMDKSNHYVNEVKSKFNELRDSLKGKFKNTTKDAENLAEKGKAKYENEKNDAKNYASDIKHSVS